MSRYLAFVLEATLLVLIVCVPLAFACTTYMSWTLMELGVAGVLLCWLLLALLQHRLCIVRTPLNLLLILLVAYVFFQMVPLPASILSVISPSRVGLELTGDPSVRLSTLPAGVPRLAMSVCRQETLQFFFQLLAYVGLFFLLVNFLRARARVARVLAVVLLAGLLVSIIGLTTVTQSPRKLYRNWGTGDDNEIPPVFNARIQKQTSAGYGFVVPVDLESAVMWFRFKSHGGDVFGCFPQTNQAAGFLVLMIPLPVAILFAYLASRRSEWGKAGGFLYSTEGNIVLLMPVLAASFLLGLVITQSRAGLVVGAVTLVLTLFFLVLTGPILRGFFTAVVLLLLTVIPVLLFGQTFFARTFKETLNLFTSPWSNDRFLFWEGALRIWRDFPLTGTGAGTFSRIHPLYNSSDLQPHFVHNDWLQWLTETGIVGTALLSIVVLTYLGIVVVGFFRMRDPLMRPVLVGTVMGTLALAAHAVFDFDFYVPANAFFCTVLAAVSVVLALDRASQQTEESFVFTTTPVSTGPGPS